MSSDKILSLVQSGYQIKQCTRSGRHRTIRFEAPLMRFYRPAVTLNEQEYRKAMRALVEWLAEAREAGQEIEICSSHYGGEWVEIRNGPGRRNNKLALSVRTMQQIKQRLMGIEARSPTSVTEAA